MTGILNLLLGAGGVIKDTYFNLVSLLLPGNGTNGAQNNTFLDSSTNNFTITRNGNTTQGTFSPFSQTGWGNYFNGSNAYLDTPSNAAFGMGTNDYTLELFFNPSVAFSANVIILDFRSATPATGQPVIYTTSARKVVFYLEGSSNLITGTTTLQVGTWYHIAVSKISGVYTLYVNGTAEGGTANNTVSVPTSRVRIGGSFVPDAYTNAYYSNVRIVKGVGVYTGNFTPPTSQLAATQSAGTNISAITTGQTSLLTCQSNRFIDNGQGNTSNTPFTITVNGDTSVVAFSPFAPTAAYTTAAVGGSGYFDGTGDYLSVADNANLRLGTSAFTIQAWVYRNASGTAHSIIAKGGASTGYVLQVTSTNVLRFTHGTTNVDTTTTIPASAWTHVAAVRTNTSTNGFQLYINGVSSATATVSTDFNQTDALYIGGDRSAANVMNGYISGLKYTNGTAETISVPTEPPTATTNVALLTNFTNAGITDATAKNDLETVGNAQISTAISAKWGSGSMYFDGTGDYLKEPLTDLLKIGSGDYTFECWLYRNNSDDAAIYTNRSTTYDGFVFGIRTNKVFMLVSQNGSTWAIDTYATTLGNSVPTTTWSHIAISRQGSSWRVFIDGTLSYTSTLSGSVFQNQPFVYIGYDSGVTLLNGYVDDLRVTKGYARYVEGTGGNAGKMVFNGTNTLALPTAPFPVQ